MRCECCKKNTATVRVYDVTQWRASALAQVCDECARLVIGQFDSTELPLPATASAIEEARQAISPGGEIELKANGGIAKWEGDPEKAIVCGGCGLTFTEFQKQGRLGCSKCYDAFQPHLDQLLERIHGVTSAEHKGRKPGDPLPNSRALVRQRIDLLKKDMQAAVKAENYEKAAELRDTISKLEKELAE